MFILIYVAKGTNLGAVLPQYAANGYGVASLVFATEKAARERAAVIHNANKNAYDFYMGELTWSAAVPPPPALEFKKIS